MCLVVTECCTQWFEGEKSVLGENSDYYHLQDTDKRYSSINGSIGAHGEHLQVALSG